MMRNSQIIYPVERSVETNGSKNKSRTQKRPYKTERQKRFEPATAEQLKDIPLRVPLIARDLAICELLLFYRAMDEGMIERMLFWEPGTTYTRAPERLRKLYHHRFIDRLNINEKMVYVLLTRGRDEIAHQRGVDPKSLDWEPDHNRRSLQHWSHLMGNNEVRILIYLGIERLQSLYILDQALLDPEIRDAAKKLIESGWSRKRVWEKVNYLLFSQQELQQPTPDPGSWLRQAVERNRRKPKGFEPKTFASPLSAVNEREEGFVLRDWLTDLDLSRLKTAKKLRVDYTAKGRQQRTGVVELDDEFEIVTPWLNKKGRRQSFRMMGEYDNLTRTLKATTPPKLDKDDPTFSNKMAKCVAMLNNGVYSKVRQRKLDKIFIVCNGGPEAVENRLAEIRDCGGENAFFVASLKVLRQLDNPADVLLAPIWRKAGDSQETHYPLIGQSWLERFKKLLKQYQIPDADITKEEIKIYQEAGRQVSNTIRTELNDAQLERVKQAGQRDRGKARELLRRFYTQHSGQTDAQALAVFADKVTRHRYNEKLDQLRKQERTSVKEKAR